MLVTDHDLARDETATAGSILRSKEWNDRHCFIYADSAVVAAKVAESADDLARRVSSFRPFLLYEVEKRLLAFVAQGIARAHAGGYCAAVAAACVAASADALVRAAKNAEEANPAALSGHAGLPDPGAPHTLAVRKLQRGVTAVTNELSPPGRARPTGTHDAANQIPSSRFDGAKLDAMDPARSAGFASACR